MHPLDWPLGRLQKGSSKHQYMSTIMKDSLTTGLPMPNRPGHGSWTLNKTSASDEIHGAGLS